MANFIRVICLSVLVVFSAEGNAQKIDSMMNIYNDMFPQEKLHVHFDKSYYNPGETIWFKGYVMSGPNLSNISKNLYAELLDEQGEVLQRKIAPIIGSAASASFDIPAKYNKSGLHFRAYTNWMLNFDTAFLYEKNIRIISAASPKPTAVKKEMFLQFFPEGGDLVDGVESLLAFKANDQYGRPVDVKGQLVNKAGKKVQDFASTHNGMGQLLFTPAKGESYKALWKDAAGKDQTTPIPDAIKGGVALHLVSNEGELVFSVRKATTDTTRLRRLVLIGHINQQIVYKSKINFAANSSVVNGTIPVVDFPAGIFQLTLFDDQEKPLQERVAFVNNYDYMFDAYMSVGAKKLTKRGKNVLEIEVPDTLLSNLSIAVTDAEINMPEEGEDNIYSRLLLTSDIKGYVHNPGYYFSSYADSVRRQLDLVMLTNGWRRFNWDDLAQGKTPVIRYEPDDYMTVQGSLTGIDPSKIPVNTSLVMIAQFKDSSRQFLTATVDRKGAFAVPGLMFYDTATIHYQFNNNKTLADRVIMNLNSNLIKQSYLKKLPSTTNTTAAYILDSAVARNKRIVQQYASLEAERAKNARILDEVVVKARVKSTIEKMDETYASGMFKGGDGYSFDLVNDPFATASMSVFQYLQGKVPGLQITNENSGSPTLTWRGGAPGVYMNEMQQDLQSIANIPMSDIAYIKVFRPPFMGGFGGANGAIAIYTKKGGEMVQDNSIKGLSMVKLAGYSPVKQFYSPNYGEYNSLHESNDLRTTLYWDPNLYFDKDKKKLTVTFYNSDITKKVRVIMEGVNNMGKLTRVEEVLE